MAIWEESGNAHMKCFALCPVPLYAQGSSVISARVPWVRWQEGCHVLLVQGSLCLEVFVERLKNTSFSNVNPHVSPREVRGYPKALVNYR